MRRQAPSGDETRRPHVARGRWRWPRPSVASGGPSDVHRALARAGAWRAQRERWLAERSSLCALMCTPREDACFRKGLSLGRPRQDACAVLGGVRPARHEASSSHSTPTLTLRARRDPRRRASGMVFDFGIVTIPLLVAAVVGAASGAAGGCWATTGSALCHAKSPPPLPPPPPSPPPSPHLQSCARTWAECGKGGIRCCNDSADACFKQNDFFSQCLPTADGCPAGWDCEAASPASPGSPPPQTPSVKPTWGFLALCAAVSAIVCAFLVGLCLERRRAARRLGELLDLRQGTPRYQSNYIQPDSNRLLPSSLTPSEHVSWFSVLSGRARASPLSMRGERSEPPPVPSLAPLAAKKSARVPASKGDTSSPHPPPPPPPPPPPTAAQQAGEEREPVRVFL